MDWSEERYVRLYQRDTVTWKRWSWQARCVFPLLLRKVDGAGILDTGTHDVAESMALLVDMPVDICRAALVDFLSSGAAVSSPRGLILPNYLAAQTTASSDRLRQQLSRERRQQAELAEITRPLVTDGHNTSQVVTPSLAKPSQAVLPPQETGATQNEMLEVQAATVVKRAIKDAKKNKPPPNPRHAPLVAKIDALGRTILAGFVFTGRDARAVSELLPRADDEEILRRMERAFRSNEFPKVRTVHGLAEHWNYFNPATPEAPTSQFNGSRHYR